MAMIQENGSLQRQNLSSRKNVQCVVSNLHRFRRQSCSFQSWHSMDIGIIPNDTVAFLDIFRIHVDWRVKTRAPVCCWQMAGVWAACITVGLTAKIRNVTACHFGKTFLDSLACISFLVAKLLCSLELGIAIIRNR